MGGGREQSDEEERRQVASTHPRSFQISSARRCLSAASSGQWRDESGGAGPRRSKGETRAALAWGRVRSGGNPVARAERCGGGGRSIGCRRRLGMRQPASGGALGIDGGGLGGDSVNLDFQNRPYYLHIPPDYLHKTPCIFIQSC